MNPFKKWLLAVVMMLVIFFESATPGKIITQIGLGPDVYHINGHFLLFFLLYFGYYKATKKPMFALALTISYALLDEFHQTFVPMRTASLEDIYVDTLAGLVATILVWKQQHVLPKKLRTWLSK